MHKGLWIYVYVIVCGRACVKIENVKIENVKIENKQLQDRPRLFEPLWLVFFSY